MGSRNELEDCMTRSRHGPNCAGEPRRQRLTRFLDLIEHLPALIHGSRIARVSTTAGRGREQDHIAQPTPETFTDETSLGTSITTIRSGDGRRQR